MLEVNHRIPWESPVAQQFKRTRLWVDTPFQSRLLLRLTWYFIAYPLLAWHLGFMWDVLSNVTHGGATKSLVEMYTDFFWKQQALLLALILLLPAILYDMLKFSHRIAGPLFRCRQVMRDMASGKEVPEFQPRQGDFMGELFAAFNALILAWNSRVALDSDASPPPKPAAPESVGAAQTTAVCPSSLDGSKT
jgi:hypothetical protein